MSGTGASSPYIKDEPEDQLFSSAHNSRFMASNHQGFNMPQQHYNQFGNNPSNGSINPSELNLDGTPMSVHNNGYMSSSFHNNFGSQTSNSAATYSKNLSVLDDDELLAGLAGPQDMNMQQGRGSGNGQDQNGFDNLDFNDQHNNMFGSHAVDMNQSHLHNGYSNTPEGNPIQSPFVFGFNQETFRQLQSPHHYSQSLQSPASYGGSPFSNNDMHSGSMGGDSYMTAKPRPRMSTSMQRKGSNTRSPLTPKTPGLGVGSLNIGSTPEPSSYPTQPIRTAAHSHRHQKTPSGQWDATPGSMNSVFSSELSSPVQHSMHPNPQISEVLKSGHHASLPAKVSNGHHAGSTPALQSQEMKRRRRRESHNLVERRRRDNINERIQELSHLVPLHRLEDEKVRKHLQNNSPLSPTLGGLSAPISMSPPQATSGLAGPGNKRATAGNITTGIPVEEKDKGPNKGDILNGAVSWTRDLMWILHVKMQQQEELANLITELGGQYPFEVTEVERRMQTELMDALQKNDVSSFTYSRAPGTGLRVPKHTDLKGDPLGGGQHGAIDSTSMSPDNQSTDSGPATLGVGGPGQYWSNNNSGGSGAGSISFKEEDEFGMDLTG